MGAELSIRDSLFDPLLLAAVGLLVLGPLVGLVGGLVRRLRRVAGRPGAPAGLAPGFRVPLVGLGVGAFATTVALVVYLVATARLALDYEKDAWVVQGGWIGVRLVGLATLVAGALLVNRAAEVRSARRAHDERRGTDEVVAADEGGNVLQVARGVTPASCCGA